MKSIFEIKAKYDISQQKRKDDIIEIMTKLKVLWKKYKAEYIVILSTILLIIILLVLFIIWVF